MSDGALDIDPSLGKTFELELMLMETAKKVGDHLTMVYPGYPFYVRADGTREGGCVLISLPRLTGEFRHIIPFSKLFYDADLKCVTQAGGDILERFGLHRGRRHLGEWFAVLAKYPEPARPVTVKRLDGTKVQVIPDEVK